MEIKKFENYSGIDPELKDELQYVFDVYLDFSEYEWQNEVDAHEQELLEKYPEHRNLISSIFFDAQEIMELKVAEREKQFDNESYQQDEESIDILTQRLKEKIDAL